MMKANYFLAFDGDLVGRFIERLIITSELDRLGDFSRNVNKALEVISALILTAHGTIHLQGGDNILAEVEDFHGILMDLGELKGDFPVSFSIGIGHTPILAYIALRYAKACGSGLAILAEEQEGSILFSHVDA